MDKILHILREHQETLKDLLQIASKYDVDSENCIQKLKQYVLREASGNLRRIGNRDLAVDLLTAIQELQQQSEEYQQEFWDAITKYFHVYSNDGY